MPKKRPSRAAYHREWRLKNKGKASGYTIAWRNRNREKFYLYHNKYERDIRIRLITLLGGSCVKCGAVDNLQIDHILAGGNKEQVAMGGNRGLYRYYLKRPEEAIAKLQVLCKSHNIEKCFVNHERWD